VGKVLAVVMMAIVVIAMFRFAAMVLAIAYALPCERGDFVVGDLPGPAIHYVRE
jgi:hypothetical protein